MSKEVIFDFDIERIEKDKLTDVMLQASSINPENYLKLADILRNSPQLENIYIHMFGGNDKFWNNFFKTFMPTNGDFTIDPQKIELEGDVQDFNCEIYKYIERLNLGNKNVSQIDEIEEKFPNLKNIQMQKPVISSEKIGGDCSKIFKLAKYMKFLNLATNINQEDAQKYLSENGLTDKFALSSDGLCIINIDRIEEKQTEPARLRINANDVERIGLERLSTSSDKITLVINSVAELSNDMLKKYQEAGLSIEGIVVYSPENEQEQNAPYSVGEYAEIRDTLEELVEGIDLNASEKERFAEVYKRICSNITYDVPAAYPLTNAQKEYSELQETNCRNLRNGLLHGKCVCAGYADILRNALSMVNIESKYIVGAVTDKVISERFLKEEKYQGDYVDKKEDGTVEVGGYHAWNKVKLDGKWYNVDATWDSTRIRLGQTPTNCLKTDEEIKKKSQKVEFEGPECVTPVSAVEIDKMFDSKHLYLGNFKLPNSKDIIAQVKLTGEVYKETGTFLKNMAIALKEKITGVFKSDKQLRLGSPNNKKNPTQSNTWDLNNWGIDSNEFMKKTKSITENINNNYQTREGKDNFENEK